MHEFIFPFPPSINALYGGGSKQRRFKSKKYKQWELLAPKTPVLNLDNIKIQYHMTFPDRRMRDSKNFLKAIDDWLVKCETIKDDNWKVLRHEEIIICGVNKKNPHIKVICAPYRADEDLCK